jgi:hypothetical protein
MPNLGAIPIHHTKIDSKGMAKIYQAVTDGPYPLSLAPEGQVCYSADSVPHLESGVVHIGFQAASQLIEKGKSCPLEILPLSIHFRYDKWGKAAMEKLLRKIENFCGFGNSGISANFSFEERLSRCRDYILEINEARYCLNGSADVSFEERLENVVFAALETAERMLGIKSEGDFFARLYKVRHISWDKIFVPDYDNLKKIPKLNRNLMDLKAGEAWYACRHQELSDFGWYFRVPIPADESPLHQKAEYVQNLYDFANRTMGGAFSTRITIQPSKVILMAAPPINLSEKITQYKEDRKTVIEDTVSELEKIYMYCIEKINKEVSD